MIRRQFLRLLALGPASTVPVLHAAMKSGKTLVHYKVSGFTCVTCAVGLDTMLTREKGVEWSRSSYREAKTTVCFHPDLVSEEHLQSAIADMGFLAEKIAQG
jgi:Cu+-exporting ATPase